MADLTVIHSEPRLTGESVLEAIRPILEEMLPRVPYDDPYHASLSVFANVARAQLLASRVSSREGSR